MKDVPETMSLFTTVSSGNREGCAGDNVTVYDSKFWRTVKGVPATRLLFTTVSSGGQ